MKTAFRLLVSVFLFALIVPSGASCDEFKIIPSIALKETNNDNIFFTQDNRTHSWITTVTPGLELIKRTERLDLNLSGLVDVARYHNEQSLDSENQYYKGRLGYTFSPKVNVQAEGGWSRSYEPDRDVYTTGLILGKVQRDRTSAGVSGNVVLTERLTAGVTYFYEQDIYNSPRVSDVEGNQVSLGLYHVLGLSTKGRFNIGYAGYRYSSQDTKSYWGTVGIEHRFHELWTIIADVGARFAQTKYEVQELQFSPPFFLVPVTVEKTSDDWGPVVRSSLNYAGEKTNFSLSFNYDLAAASGRDGPVERTALLFNIRHRLIYEFSGAVSTGYFLNKASAGQFGLTEINEETFWVSPSVRYEFTKDVYLDLAYEYTKTNYRETNTSASRNLVYVRLFAQHTLLE